MPENLIKIYNNRVYVEDVTYPIPNGFFIDTEMSGQSDYEIVWVSEDESYSIDISASDTKGHDFIEDFVTFFPEDYERICDFTPFEYNNLTGVYVMLSEKNYQSFELKAYANKDKTRFLDVVIEARNKDIKELIKDDFIKNFLNDIRMD